MSADMMVICHEWFLSRFCGAPGTFERIYGGITSHIYTEVRESDVLAVQDALEKLECHKGLDKTRFLEYMKSHIGKHISTENW
jgi:hypothetical protein